MEGNMSDEKKNIKITHTKVDFQFSISVPPAKLKISQEKLTVEASGDVTPSEIQKLSQDTKLLNPDSSK